MLAQPNSDARGTREARSDDGYLGCAQVMAKDWLNGAVTVWANDLERGAEWFFWAGRDQMVRLAMDRLAQTVEWAKEDSPGEERRYGRPLRFSVRGQPGAYVVVDERDEGRVVCGPTAQRKDAHEAYWALNDKHQRQEGQQ